MEVEEITKDFVFDEHILRMDYTPQKNKNHQEMERIFNKAKRIFKISLLGNNLVD